MASGVKGRNGIARQSIHGTPLIRIPEDEVCSTNVYSFHCIQGEEIDVGCQWEQISENVGTLGEETLQRHLWMQHYVQLCGKLMCQMANRRECIGPIFLHKNCSCNATPANLELTHLSYIIGSTASAASIAANIATSCFNFLNISAIVLCSTSASPSQTAFFSYNEIYTACTRNVCERMHPPRDACDTSHTPFCVYSRSGPLPSLPSLYTRDSAYTGSYTSALRILHTSRPCALFMYNNNYSPRKVELSTLMSIPMSAPMPSTSTSTSPLLSL